MSERSFVALTRDVEYVRAWRADNVGKIAINLGAVQVYLLPADARTLLTQLSAAVLHSEPCERLLAKGVYPTAEAHRVQTPEVTR